MTTTNDMVASLMSNIPQITSCGVLDLETSKWRRLVHGRSDPEELLDFVALSVKKIFGGDRVKTIKTLLDEHSTNRPRQREFEEVILRSTNFLHVFLRLHHEPGTALCAVVSGDVKLGIVLNLMRTAIDRAAGPP